jgi:serine protease AprX
MVFSQTKNEQEKVVKSYNTTKISVLKNKLKNQKNQRNKAINEFIIKNPNVKKTIRYEDGTVKEIKYIIDNQPIYVETHNTNSARATRTDFLHPGGGLDLNLEGENMIIGVWDGDNVRDTHVEFLNDDLLPSSRITTPDFGSSDVYGDHASHVAGTIVAKGTNTNAKGMAPKAEIKSYDWDSDSLEALQEATNNALLLSNHSYGVPVQQNDNFNYLMGSYSAESREWDEITHAAEYYLPVISAGNDGQLEYNGGLANGYDKLVGNKTSKNTMVVANASNPFIQNDGNLLFMNINTSSSQGPTDDGRIKPDISGDGTSLFSCGSSTDNSYYTASGTSMSAPNVSGTLLLLQEYYSLLNGQFMRAATLKALACHTADDDNTVGPDPIFGWGLLNAKVAAETILDDKNSLAQIYEGTLNQGETYTYEFSTGNSGELKATLCWTDPPGAVNTSLNSPQSTLINDLDLRVIGNGTTYYPWKLNPSSPQSWATNNSDNNVDTVEGVLINNAPNGDHTISISHKGSLQSGNQNFSLIITGANLSLSTSSASLGNNDLVIWSNGVEKELNLKYSTTSQELAKIVLFDVQGRIIFEDTIEPKNGEIRGKIKTSKFSNGIYVINFRQGKNSLNQKVFLK